MVVGRLAPHTILAPNTTLSTYPNCCLAALLAASSPSFPPPTAGFPRSGFPTPNSPTPQTITHTHHTAPNSTTEHCTTTSQHPTTILPLYILHSLTHLLTTPSSCSSNPASSNPPNPHFTPPQTNNRDAANSGTEHHRPAMDAGKRAPAYQLLAQSGPGLSSLPWSLRGARNGTGRSPDKDKVRDASV